MTPIKDRARLLLVSGDRRQQLPVKPLLDGRGPRHATTYPTDKICDHHRPTIAAENAPRSGVSPEIGWVTALSACSAPLIVRRCDPSGAPPPAPWSAGVRRWKTTPTIPIASIQITTPPAAAMRASRRRSKRSLLLEPEHPEVCAGPRSTAAACTQMSHGVGALAAAQGDRCQIERRRWRSGRQRSRCSEQRCSSVELARAEPSGGVSPDQAITGDARAENNFDRSSGHKSRRPVI